MIKKVKQPAECISYVSAVGITKRNERNNQP